MSGKELVGWVFSGDKKLSPAIIAYGKKYKLGKYAM
jgi:hypothetical protein